MIIFYLSRLLGERKMSQAELSRTTGIRPNTISQMYHGVVERIGIDQLDRICEALGCELRELMEHMPNEHVRTGKGLILEKHGGRKQLL